ncbi:MAG: dihydroneopterin aldolase [Actinomycetota bacterium]|nr:dihydroneopterin aldolase [Actinomycetota bacterium]
MDRIEIRGLRVHAHHGVYEAERRDGQTFVIDVTLHRDLMLPSRTDALIDTVDYGALAQRLVTAATETRFDLIEALAGHLADLALAAPGVQAAEVRVAKPQTAIAADLDEVAVVVTRRAQP